MKLFDLHCDTPLEVYLRRENFSRGDLHVTADKLAAFEKYRQFAAFCAPYGMSDGEAYGLFFRVAEDFREKAFSCGFTVARSLNDKNANFYLTVEDARILGGDERKLCALFDAGVSLVTPLWGGSTCIGGAHDTDEGLTPFGEDIVEKCAEAGVPVDISHASPESADRIMTILAKHGMPPVATHSNAYSLCPHTRNLTDAQIEAIRDAGGLVGVSLYPPHLCERPESGCTADDAARHIIYYLEKLGPDSVALGCDFDGIGSTPADLRNVSELPNLKDALTRRGVCENIIDKVFYENAQAFFDNVRNLKGKLKP